MTKRTCKTCAWWGEIKEHTTPPSGTCHVERLPMTSSADHWCRHWSNTTGWDWATEQPTQLEQWAYDMLSITEGATVPLVDGTVLSNSMRARVRIWIEEYNRVYKGDSK